MYQYLAIPVVAGLATLVYKLTKYKIKPPIIQNMPGNTRLDPVAPKEPPHPVAVVIGTTPAGNPVRVLTPINGETGKATVLNMVATQGKAIDAAHALYDYLKANGRSATAQLADLVTKFQTIHNTDPEAKRVAAALDVNGKYDLATSSTLTVYMGDPLPPDPSIPLAPNSAYANSPYALSSSNLWAYLRLHGNDKSAALKEMVKRFQHDVNTDTTFPGPANTIPAARVIKTKLVEDGLYGKATSDALAAVTFERINP